MKILIAGDIHFPFHNERAVNAFLAAVKREKPTHVVQIGDLYDQYSFSRYTKKNIVNPDQELSEARKLGEWFWKSVKQNSPKARCYQILGNHDIRMIKRTQEKLPELGTVISEFVQDLYKFTGVKTLTDDRDILTVGDVNFHHGYLSKLGDHMRSQRRSMVVGHSHVGGVVLEQIGNKTLFELNAGHLADETSEPLRYRPTKTSKWTLGFGVVDRQGPRFVPV
jgi:predicted phosphodiesterase